jgi:mycothiol synthase
MMSAKDHFQGLTGMVTRPAIMDDLPAAVEFFNLYSLATIGVREHSLESVRRQWTSPRFNPESNTRLVLSHEGDWIGYAGIWDSEIPPARVFVNGYVHPEFQRQGIGTQLQTWAEDHARQSLTRVPEGIRATIRMTAPSTDQSAIDLYKRRGATLVRRFCNMKIDLDPSPVEPNWPDGLRIITFDAFKDLEAVYRADDEAFRDHWGYVEEPFETGFEQWKHWLTGTDDFDPTLWFLALDGEQIAGISLCRETSDEDLDMGWVRVLAVRRPWRKRGLGLALLQHSFAMLKQRGKKRAGLGVDSGSLTGATRLYEKAGMHVHRTYDSYEIEMRPGRDLARMSIEE